ncbi:XRE family transcriptional regulator, partial [bacterium]
EDRAVGARLRELRRERRMSQRVLGEALGVTFQQVQKYEQGTNRITGVRMRRAADLLGVPLGYFHGVPGGGDSARLMHLFESITDGKKRQAILTLVESMV